MGMNKPFEAENKLPNIIGQGAKFVGDIETSGDIRVDGVIEGNIKCQGKIVLGQGGSIKGGIKCASAELSGAFEGKMEVADLLSLKSTSTFKGEMTTAKLSIEPGAMFNGTCVMGRGNAPIANNDSKK